MRTRIRIALLRGVNVGGKNILSMAALKDAFIKAGFADATTYINSGNVLFSSNENNQILQKTIEKLLADEFGIKTPVAVISAQELSEALDAAPSWWGEEADARHNAIFVIHPITAPMLCAEVGEIKPAYEKLAYHGSMIFWSASMKTFSRAQWASLSRKPVYLHVTIRNRNTALKLRRLAEGMQGGAQGNMQGE